MTVPLELPPLSAAEILLWRIDVDHVSAIYEYTGVLSPDETARADRFVHTPDWTRYVIGRGALRMLLGHYLQQPPQSIRFAYGATGKPFLNMPDVPIMHFSVSHSAGMILIALSRQGEIGVDVELVRRADDEEDLARLILNARELAHYLSAPAHARTRLFYRYWTCKEAVVKSVGGGIDDVGRVEIPHLLAKTFDPPDEWLHMPSEHLPSARFEPVSLPGDAPRYIYELERIAPYVGAVSVGRDASNQDNDLVS